jgi:methylisocitrate lyase
MEFTRDELNNLFTEKEAVMEAKDKPTTKPDKESKANVVDTMQTREELYERINYHSYEQAIDKMLGNK